MCSSDLFPSHDNADSGFNIMGMPAVEFDEDGGKPKIAWNGTDK